MTYVWNVKKCTGLVIYGWLQILPQFSWNNGCEKHTYIEKAVKYFFEISDIPIPPYY